MNKNLNYLVRPGGTLSGTIHIPGDKSISHRTVMLASLAKGHSTIRGFLWSEDCQATMRAFKQMGVNFEINNDQLIVNGVGMHGLKPPSQPIDCGNSGTSIRLLAGLLAGQDFDSTLTGDDSLLKRPMERVIDPLTLMGAKISACAGKAPLMLTGGQTLTGIHYQLPVASAQVKSSLLFAGMYAQGETIITEPSVTRDHTERMLATFKYPIKKDKNNIMISGGGELQPCEIEVPADLSSAAFFIVGAAISKGSDILLTHVGMNPTRIGVITILRQMGADIQILNERKAGNEPIADIRVRYSKLHGIEIPQALIPLTIDEFPILFIAAACADGKMTLRGAKELRYKESDRIAAMVKGLNQLGIQTTSYPDGVVIEGGQMSEGVVDSFGDHRIAMSFIIAAIRARGAVIVKNCENIATSFTNFAETARKAGIDITMTAEI